MPKRQDALGKGLEEIFEDNVPEPAGKHETCIRRPDGEKVKIVVKGAGESIALPNDSE